MSDELDITWADLADVEEQVRWRIAEGFACYGCGLEDSPMIPLGRGPRGQIFIHEECQT